MYFKTCEVLAVLCILFVISSATENRERKNICDLTKNYSLTINCSKRDLKDIPDSWPPEVENIDKNSDILISLNNNSISNVSVLPSIPAARVALNLKHNNIAHIVEDAFSDLHNIVYLDWSYNSISGEILRSKIFQGPYKNGKYSCISLEILDLGHNNVHSLDKNLFLYTPNLTRLFLNNNPLEILDSVTILALASATGLEILDLSHTDIESIPEDAFIGMGKLQQLDLSGNRFTTVPESLREVGATLKYLTFNQNPIEELDDDSFRGLSKLIEIDVSENGLLEEVGSSTFTPLKSLQVLHLNNNRNLKYISHNAFKGLKDKWTLKEVYLTGNKLNKLATDLMPWSKLEVLSLADNEWYCNCDLGNIVIKQRAGIKFKIGDVPKCAAPSNLVGTPIVNITPSFCPTFDTTFAAKNKFNIFNLKPKHLLWSLFGVTMIVFMGMLTGLLINGVKNVYGNKNKRESIPYKQVDKQSKEILYSI